ncbi:MAG: type II toxin-antitoxin system RelE/ParE family toxin [Bacteroidia bacterium]
MVKQVIWSKRAESDFDQITEYLIDEWSESVCIIFVNKVFETIDRVCLFPTIYPAFTNNKSVRKAMINKHVTMFYRVSQGKTTMEILTFFNNSQSPSRLGSLE